MQFLGIFLVELILLFSLAKAMTDSLARLFFNLTKSQNFTVNLLAILFLPGTIIHELSHVLLAGVMLVPVGEIDVLPKIEESGVRLGSAQVGQTDPLRRLLIGSSPIIFGLGIILGVLWIGQGYFSQSTPWWQIGLVLYLIFEVANTMFSSKKDMEGALAFLGAMVAIIAIPIALLVLTDNLSLLSWIKDVSLPDYGEFFKKVSLALVIPLALDLILLLVSSILVGKKRQ